MSLRTALIAGAGIVAAVAMAASAATLAELGHAVGWAGWLRWALPVAVDVLALVAGVAWLAAGVAPGARQLGRTLTLVSVAVSVLLNAIGHLVATRYMTPGPWLVIGVSAVPPLAAALAVHLTAAITAEADAAEGDTPAPERDTAPAEVDTPVSPTPRPAAVPAPVEPQVICGGHLQIPTVPPRPRLGTEAARAAIEQAWRDGLSIREAARVSTRAASQVQRVYARLDTEAPRPIEGQTEIALGDAA
ncbi:DUF2637 domain-containing protein [Streptomyces sp. NPDC006925]|uniref:DUF2637 domain-containing protein n=1 Tax=Streptomyces sp. NPDC006925 TaxID=3364768 RepID=UPI0036836BAC